MKLDVTSDLALILKQNTPIVVLESSQEKQALESIVRVGRRQSKSVYRWSITDGLETLGFGPRLVREADPESPEELLKKLKARNEGGIFVLCDFHFHINDDAKIIRLLKDIALDFDSIAKQIVLLSHQLELPSELMVFSARAKLALPTDEELLAIIRRQAQRYSDQIGGGRIKTDGKALNELLAGFRGMTHSDVERLAYHAIADDGAITYSDIPKVAEAKFSLLNQRGLLHYVFDTESFAQVGGLENMKQWLTVRKSKFLDESTLPADRPKGMLLTGVQGAGKSLAAKAVAGMWRLPLLQLDMGSLYNKYIGETEKRLRDSLEQAELMQPCVLWMDELEKALGQSANDDGLSKRLLGYLLTWMAERKSSVFLVATSNNLSALPAELVRKGRFDEIFFVDLPGLEVRKEIFDIHLSKRGLSLTDEERQQLARLSEGFSGAEIEQAVVSASYELTEARGLTIDHVASALTQTTPLSMVMSEQVSQLRLWAEGRAVPA